MYVMKVLRDRLAGLLIVCCFVGAASTARADNEPKNMTAGEKALLPVWCLDAQSFGYGDASFNTSPRAGHWVALMGKTFWAAHHHCWALIRMHRARAAGLPANIRLSLIEGAIGDYQYVLANATPDFPLLPEVYTRMGEAYIAFGVPSQAMEAFAMARKIKPDYWPPYVRWAEVLVKSGRSKEGLEHVEHVMKMVPEDVELQRQYRLLQAAAGRSQPKPVAASGSRPAAAKSR